MSLSLLLVVVSGRTIIGSKSGPKNILSDQQEDYLGIGCSSIGFPKSRIEVMSLINQMYRYME